MTNPEQEKERLSGLAKQIGDALDGLLPPNTMWAVSLLRPHGEMVEVCQYANTTDPAEICALLMTAAQQVAQQAALSLAAPKTPSTLQ